MKRFIDRSVGAYFLANLVHSDVISDTGGRYASQNVSAIIVTTRP